MRQYIFITVVVFLSAILAFTFFIGPPVDPTLLKPAEFQYPTSNHTSCPTGANTGSLGISEDIETKEGATYNLRTP
ncbi:MAG: hypothetical protein ABGX64_00680, partial [Cycloclasticus sp.]